MATPKEVTCEICQRPSAPKLDAFDGTNYCRRSAAEMIGVWAAECYRIGYGLEVIKRADLTESLLELVRRREREAERHHGDQWMNGSDGRYARARAVLQKIGAL